MDSESTIQHSDDDDCPAGHDAHIDTEGHDHRYHCCEHDGCVLDERDEDCVLVGMKKIAADELEVELTHEREYHDFHCCQHDDCVPNEAECALDGMTNDEVEEYLRHSDDDDCPPHAWPHMDTGGCDHRYHCCEHHGGCVEMQDGCVLLGMRKDEAEKYAKELEEHSEET